MKQQRYRQKVLSPSGRATLLLATFLVLSMGWPAASSQLSDSEVETVFIPYMDRAAPHREYANTLLKRALALSEDRYGPYRLVQQRSETVIRRQLLELIKGDNLSVATSMPMPDWLNNVRRIPFPIMKGLASYRVFLANSVRIPEFNRIDSLEALKSFRIGQGPGWSTANILEANGFDVVYGGPYETLLPMLKAGRFDLFMRGVYEAKPELEAYRDSVPGLGIVDGFAVITYLPMYFFVSKERPELAERLEYGLIKAHESGELDRLFNRYFNATLGYIESGQRNVFYMPNTNIDTSIYEQDRQYLLEAVNKLTAGTSRSPVAPSKE